MISCQYGSVVTGNRAVHDGVQVDATTSDASLCSRADELKQANIPLQLVSGWLDSTAAAAINVYHYCGQAPGVLFTLSLCVLFAHGLADQVC